MPAENCTGMNNQKDTVQSLPNVSRKYLMKLPALVSKCFMQRVMMSSVLNLPNGKQPIS